MIPVPGGWPTIVTNGLWFITKRRSFFIDRAVFVEVRSADKISVSSYNRPPAKVS